MSNIGFIYKLWSKTDPSLVYYGSTTQKHVCSRITGHRNSYKQWKHGKYNFVTSFLIIETEDWDYMTCEKVIFDDPFELKNRERFYIEKNECVNKCVPNQTTKEYYIENKDKLLEQMKQYRVENKEEITEYNKQYYIENKDKRLEQMKQYRDTHKDEASQYRIANRDKILEQNKQYRIDNKKNITANASEIVQCECGTCVRFDGLRKHRNSKKHKTIMLNLQNTIIM